MTEEEYLAYDLDRDGKHEFVNGEVVAMAGVTEAHSALQVNLTLALGTRLRGSDCRVRGSDLRVRLDETGLYCYPDLTIVCGEPEFMPTRPVTLLNPRVMPTRPVTLLNPRVIVEVLSESTEEYDRGAKVAHYRHRGTVDLILLVDSQRRLIERQQRHSDGTWTLSEHSTGVLRVLDLEVPVDELYDGVDLAG